MAHLWHSFDLEDVMNVKVLLISMLVSLSCFANAYAAFVAEGDIVGDGTVATTFADEADATVTINNGTVWSTTEFTKFANKADFTLNLESGAQMNLNHMYSGMGDQTELTINMSGAGTKLSSTGFFFMNTLYGIYPDDPETSSKATISMSQGAQLDFNIFWMGRGHAPLSQTNIYLTGLNTKITATGGILDWNGNFNLSILDNASVYTYGDTTLMGSDASTGSILIDNGIFKHQQDAGTKGKFEIGGGIDSNTYDSGIADMTIRNGGLLDSYQLIMYKNVSLKGDGTIKTDDYFHNYGTIRPGNGVGTFNIEGDYTHKDKARLEIELADKSNDLLHVTQDVILEGGQLNLSLVGEISQSKTMTILQADNSLTGTFDTVNPFEETQFLKYDGVSYDANSVKVNVLKKANFVDIATDEREETIAKALDNLTGSNNEDTSVVIAAVQQLKTVEEVKDAYKEVAGTDRTSIVAATLDNMTGYMGSISNRIHSSSGHTNMFAASGLRSLNNNDLILSYGNGGMFAPYKRWGLWGQAYGVRTDMESNEQYEGYLSQTQGYSMGADFKLNPNLTLGLAYGYSTSDIDYVSDDFGDVHGQTYSLYASYIKNNHYTDLMLNYGKNNNKSSRHVQFGSIDRIAESDYDSKLSSAYLESGLNFKVGKNTITPALAIQMASVATEAYDETGAGSLNLSYDSSKTESYKMALALELSREIVAKRNKSLIASFKLKLDHEFGDRRQVQVAHLGGSQGQEIELSGREISRDTYTLGTSLKAKASENTQISLDYSYSFNDDLDSHFLGLLLKYMW